MYVEFCDMFFYICWDEYMFFSKFVICGNTLLIFECQINFVFLAQTPLSHSVLYFLNLLDLFCLNFVYKLFMHFHWEYWFVVCVLLLFLCQFLVSAFSLDNTWLYFLDLLSAHKPHFYFLFQQVFFWYIPTLPTIIKASDG